MVGPLSAHKISTTRIARKMYSNAFGSLKIWPVVLSWILSISLSFLAFSNDLHYISDKIPFFRLWWVVSNEWHVEVNTSGRVSRKKIGNDVQNIYCACNRAYTHTQTTNAFSVILMMMMTRSRCRPRGHWFSFSVRIKAFFCSDGVFWLPEPLDELCNVKCKPNFDAGIIPISLPSSFITYYITKSEEYR